MVSRSCLHLPVLFHNLRQQQPAFAPEGHVLLCQLHLDSFPSSVIFLQCRGSLTCSWAACLYPLGTAGSYLSTASPDLLPLTRQPVGSRLGPRLGALHRRNCIFHSAQESYVQLSALLYGPQIITLPSTCKVYPYSTQAAPTNCRSASTQRDAELRRAKCPNALHARYAETLTFASTEALLPLRGTWPQSAATLWALFLSFEGGLGFFLFSFLRWYQTGTGRWVRRCSAHSVVNAVQGAPLLACLPCSWWLPHELKWQVSGQRENCLFKSSPDSTALLWFTRVNARGTLRRQSCLC